MSTASTQEVLDLLVARVATVLGVDGPVTPETRFDEDLHADSLDLVEVVESVERALRAKGYQLTVDDDELLTVQTVGEAAERIAAGISG